MDLKQIEYFVRVAELGSFTRASVVLDIAQPALSRQVRLLEVELRQNLLVRNGRGATPTEAGKLLLEHGRGILHQVERAREELGRVRGALAGRVAIGLPPSIAKVLTVPLTRAFRVKLPDCTQSTWLPGSRCPAASNRAMASDARITTSNASPACTRLAASTPPTTKWRTRCAPPRPSQAPSTSPCPTPLALPA